MIPLRDVIPARSTPLVTLSLIAVTTLVSGIGLTQSPDAAGRLLYAYGVVPEQFRATTLLSASFLHASWLHLVVNMWGLWIFGENVEDRLGHMAFAVFYLVCGAIGAMGLSEFAPASSVPIVGASGAVAGCMGAYVVLYPRSRVLTFVTTIASWDLLELPAVGLLWVWFLLQFVGFGSLAATAHTDAPALSGATYMLVFLFGAAGIAAAGKRRLPAAWW